MNQAHREPEDDEMVRIQRTEAMVTRRVEAVVHRLYHATLPLEQRLLMVNRELAALSTPSKIIDDMGLRLPKDKLYRVVQQLREQIKSLEKQDTKRVNEEYESRFDEEEIDPLEKLLGKFSSDSEDSSSSSGKPRPARKPHDFPLRTWNVITHIEREHLRRTSYGNRLKTGLESFKVLEFPSSTKDLDFYIIPGALSQEDIECCKICHKFPEADLIKDRHDELDYVHKVWRVEDALINRFYKCFQKMMFLIEAIDCKYWKKLRQFDHLYPETEFILYDKRLHKDKKELPYVGPHVDNESVITFIGMLSDSTEYEGGVNYFESAGIGRPDRFYHLQAGDVCIFRGEELEHWVSSVNEGSRCIVQIEVSFSKNNRDYSDDETESEVERAV